MSKKVEKMLRGNLQNCSKSKDAEYFMQLAVEQAHAAAKIGEVPIGAVVVQNFDEPHQSDVARNANESKCSDDECESLAPRIVASAHNLKETTNNPAGHAEFLALQEAAKNLGRWRLSDCTVFVTLEPCFMCAGLMHQARIARCVYGTTDSKAGALGTLYDVAHDERLNHNFDVQTGVMQIECAQLLKDFFRLRRK